MVKSFFLFVDIFQISLFYPQFDSYCIILLNKTKQHLLVTLVRQTSFVNWSKINIDHLQKVFFWVRLGVISRQIFVRMWQKRLLCLPTEQRQQTMEYLTDRPTLSLRNLTKGRLKNFQIHLERIVVTLTNTKTNGWRMSNNFWREREDELNCSSLNLSPTLAHSSNSFLTFLENWK